jgi:ABC-type amino acid transport substrate-binding protein
MGRYQDMSTNSAARRGRITLTAVAILATAVAGGCTRGEPRAAQASNAAASSSSASDTLKKVKDAGVLTVGVKFDTPPYGFIPKGKSEPEGFDIDISKEIAKRLGVKVKFVQVTAKNRTPYLETGKIDLIAASMFHTRTRDEAIDFSITYFEDQDKLLVPADSTIKGVQDLKGKTVSLTQGSTQELDVKKAAPGVKTLTYQTWPDTLQAMLRGEADAVVSSTGILVGLEQTANAAGEHVKVVGNGFAPSPVGIGMRQNDSGFRDAVNFALMDMAKDGTYDAIFKKWWGNIVPDAYQIQTWPKGS